MSTLHPATLMCETGFERSGSTCTRHTPAQPRCASEAWTRSGWTCTGPRAVAPTGCPTGFTLGLRGPGLPGYNCTPQTPITDADCPTPGSRLHQSAGEWSCVTTVAPTGCPTGFTLRPGGPPDSGQICTPQTPIKDADCASGRLQQLSGAWTCVTTVAPTGCPDGYTLNAPTGAGSYTCTPTTTTTTTAPPEQACSTDLETLGSQAVPPTGNWSTSCLSTQRGNAGTPYYAKRYTFTLAAAAQVTASVSSDQSTAVYLLSDPHPEDTVPHASGTTHASAPLPAGNHQIEVARSKPRLTDGSFTLTVSIEAADCSDGETRVYGGSCSPVGQRVYEFTKSTIVSTREAAIRALEVETCVSLTVDKLSALMLAVPERELQRSSPSPMSLSRGDNLAQNPDNIWLYSNKTLKGERRAHWHPGVGLWQLDIWGPAKTFNHGERADILKGGAGVAAHIRDMFCRYSGQTIWSQKVYRPWYGCRDESKKGTPEYDRENRDLCEPPYRDIYDEDGDSLWVVATEGSEIDGGVQDRHCAWSSSRPAATDSGFGCFLYDPARHQGNMFVKYPEGTDSEAAPNGYTPLAVAFISLTNPKGTERAGTKYAVFPAARTGYAHTLIKAVPRNKYSRQSTLGPDGNGWYAGGVDGNTLYVREGTNEQCRPPAAATMATCEWTPK